MSIFRKTSTVPCIVSLIASLAAYGCGDDDDCMSFVD